MTQTTVGVLYNSNSSDIPCCICRNGIKATGDLTVIIRHKQCGFVIHPQW